MVPPQESERLTLGPGFQYVFLRLVGVGLCAVASQREGPHMAVLQEPSRPVWLADDASVRDLIAELNVADRAFLEYLRQSWELPTLVATVDRIYSGAPRDARKLR